MRNGFVILQDQWPLVHVRFPAHPTDDDIITFCEDLAPIYERGFRAGEAFACIVDMRALKTSGAADRRRALLTEKLDGLQSRFPNVLLGDALVVENDLMRLFVNVGVMLRRDKRVVRKVFDDMEGATAWAKELLAAWRGKAPG